MKLIGAVFIVFAVLAFIGSTLGDGEVGDLGSQTAAGGASPGSEVRDCPRMTIEDSERLIPSGYINMATQCLMVNKTEYQHLGDSTELEEYRVFTQNYCQRVETMKECLAEGSTTSRACLNATRYQGYQIFSDFMATILDVGCADNGDQLAIVMHGIENQVDLLNGIFVGCLEAAGPSKTTMDLLAFYLQIQGIQQCLLSQLKDEDVFKNQLNSFTSEILDKVKCIHPENQTTVLCNTIVSN